MGLFDASPMGSAAGSAMGGAGGGMNPQLLQMILAAAQRNGGNPTGAVMPNAGGVAPIGGPQMPAPPQGLGAMAAGGPPPIPGGQGPQPQNNAPAAMSASPTDALKAVQMYRQAQQAQQAKAQPSQQSISPMLNSPAAVQAGQGPAPISAYDTGYMNATPAASNPGMWSQIMSWLHPQQAGY